VARPDLRLVGVDDGVERSAIDDAFVDEQRLERFHAQSEIRRYGLMFVIVLVMFVSWRVRRRRECRGACGGVLDELASCFVHVVCRHPTPPESTQQVNKSERPSGPPSENRAQGAVERLILKAEPERFCFSRNGPLAGKEQRVG